ncbi:hypothetical protein CC2G_009703 [Coprinopsis cinerea AmutBmut pab1-1]|nr:hypothetical protein CC2G_009703 [Coprinopsis cinerea AmutBmut pab1-1]
MSCSQDTVFVQAKGRVYEASRRTSKGCTKLQRVPNGTLSVESNVQEVDVTGSLAIPCRTKEEWTSILRLSTKWEMNRIKELAMKHLEAMNLPPIEKFKLGVEYCVPGWYGDALSQLVSENLFDKDREFWEIDKIFNADWETAALALWVRGRAMQSLFEQEEMVRTRGVTAATTFVADRATRELENLA